MHEYQLRNKALAPFCAAKVGENEEQEMSSCFSCGQYRACIRVREQPYCIVKCAAKAKRGSLGHQGSGDIPPRTGR